MAIEIQESRRCENHHVISTSRRAEALAVAKSMSLTFSAGKMAFIGIFMGAQELDIQVSTADMLTICRRLNPKHVAARLYAESTAFTPVERLANAIVVNSVEVGAEDSTKEPTQAVTVYQRTA